MTINAPTPAMSTANSVLRPSNRNDRDRFSAGAGAGAGDAKRAASADQRERVREIARQNRRNGGEYQ